MSFFFSGPSSINPVTNDVSIGYILLQRRSIITSETSISCTIANLHPHLQLFLAYKLCRRVHQERGKGILCTSYQIVFYFIFLFVIKNVWFDKLRRNMSIKTVWFFIKIIVRPHSPNSYGSDSYYVQCLVFFSLFHVNCYSFNQQHYATTFPIVSVEDMVKSQFLLLDSLGVEKVV